MADDRMKKILDNQRKREEIQKLKEEKRQEEIRNKEKQRKEEIINKLKQEKEIQNPANLYSTAASPLNPAPEKPKPEVETKEPVVPAPDLSKFSLLEKRIHLDNLTTTTAKKVEVTKVMDLKERMAKLYSTDKVDEERIVRDEMRKAIIMNDLSLASLVTFKIHYTTVFGENLHILGSSGELGLWQVEKAIKMQWTEGHYWTHTLNLFQGNHKYKYIIVDEENKIIRKEGDPLHEIIIKSEKEEKLLFEDNWINDINEVNKIDIIKIEAPKIIEDTEKKLKEVQKLFKSKNRTYSSY